MKNVNKMILKKSKLGQEEMIGFGLIIVLVAVILLVFLAFSLKNPVKENVESYEIEGFISALLQHTTDCGNYRTSHLSIRELIIDCGQGETCLDNRDTCEVLNSTLSGILEQSWKVSGDRPTKGYQLKILRNEVVSQIIQKGNVTTSYKSHMQDLGRSSTQVLFTAYY